MSSTPAACQPQIEIIGLGEDAEGVSSCISCPPSNDEVHELLARYGLDHKECPGSPRPVNAYRKELLLGKRVLVIDQENVLCGALHKASAASTNALPQRPGKLLPVWFPLLLHVVFVSLNGLFVGIQLCMRKEDSLEVPVEVGRGVETHCGWKTREWSRAEGRGRGSRPHENFVMRKKRFGPAHGEGRLSKALIYLLTARPLDPDPRVPGG